LDCRWTSILQGSRVIPDWRLVIPKATRHYGSSTAHGRSPGSSPSQDVPQPTPWLTRRLARLFAGTLDRQLARGESPETTRLLAARAMELVSSRERRILADGLGRVLRHAQRPPVARTPRVPIDRAVVASCECEIDEVIKALLMPGPVPARGPAMVSQLLAEGTGPLYNSRCPLNLVAALNEARLQLDPALPLEGFGAIHWPRGNDIKRPTG
jgi:hypothetical protein